MTPSQLNIGTNPPPPPSNNSNSGPAVDLFGNSGGDLFQTPMAPKASAAQNNLLGDLLSPSRPAASQPAAPSKSASEQMVDDMLSQLGGANLSNSNQQQQQQQQKLGRPNYNSAFFKVQTVLLFWRPSVNEQVSGAEEAIRRRRPRGRGVKARVVGDLRRPAQQSRVHVIVVILGRFRLRRLGDSLLCNWGNTVT